MRHEVAKELTRATRLHPEWPTDPLHAVGILNEEVGELNRAILQGVYEVDWNNERAAGRMLDAVREEAIQVAAMAERFIASLEEYAYAKSSAHRQG